jgi:23S rRNA (pseudouridine1915-N3)-methyltransferase
LFAVGRLKEEYLRAAEVEYCKRLRPYCRLDVTEHRDEAALLASVPPSALVVACDERGEQISSQTFAQEIVARARETSRELVFLIGGPDGHSPQVPTRAERCIAFGRMTIAHRLVRIVLLEQIYRSFTILRGHPYHR